MAEDKNYKDLLERIDKVVNEKKLDVNVQEDLCVGIMNLIGIEEHLFFTAEKTGKRDFYYKILNEVRKMRVELLKKIIKDYEGEIWCLPAGTKIYGNPEIKSIEKVSSNEKVLTLNGKYSPVKKTFVRDYKGELVSIQPYYGDSLVITPAHLVLCATGVRRKQKDLWRKNFKKPKLIWKKAEELNDADFMIFPRLRYNKDINSIKLEYSWTNSGCFKPTKFKQTKRIKVTKNLMELIGYYISEGSISERNSLYKGKIKKGVNLYFSFGKHEKKLIRRAQDLFKEIFKEELKISETHSTIDLVCSKRIIASFFKQFGKNSHEKQLPLWVLQLPAEKIYPLIFGLVIGDGLVDKYSFKYFTVSEKLAYQLRLLLFKIGILHSLKRKENVRGGKIDGRKIISRYPLFSFSLSGDAARIIKGKTSLRYNVNRTSGNFGYVTQKYILIPIKKINKVKYSGKVHNIQAETETYTTFTGVVHNCTSKHLLAASMRMTEVGTKNLKEGKDKEAKEYFERAYNLYNLFWALNMKMVDTKTIKAKGIVTEEDIEKARREEKGDYSGKENEDNFKSNQNKNFFGKLGDLIKKAIDCCKE